MFGLVQSERNEGDGGKEEGDRKENGKNGFDGNTPDAVKVNFGFLSLFEGVELAFREKVTVIFRTGVYGDVSRNRVISDAGHGFFTDGTTQKGRGGNLIGRFLRKNGVEIFGGTGGNEVSDQRRQEVSATIVAFVNLGFLIVGSCDINDGHGVGTSRAEHNQYFTCIFKICLCRWIDFPEMNGLNR